jgi:hypothetical protein
MTDEVQLRTASDTFLARLDRLHQLEVEKRLLTPGTDRMVTLAAEIESLVQEVLGVAGTQLDIARNAAALDGELRPIEAIPPRDAAEVLVDWRAAERRLSAAAPGGADEAMARSDIERLRDEYRRAFELRQGR